MRDGLGDQPKEIVKSHNYIRWAQVKAAVDNKKQSL